MRLRVNNGNLPYFKFKRVLRAPPTPLLPTPTSFIRPLRLICPNIVSELG